MFVEPRHIRAEYADALKERVDFRAARVAESKRQNDAAAALHTALLALGLPGHLSSVRTRWGGGVDLMLSTEQAVGLAEHLAAWHLAP